MPKKQPGWWNDFFPVFRPVFDMIPQKVSNAEMRYVVEKLGLKPGSKFLDCPCGIGRISIPLAKKGIKVTGVDITESYLDELDKKSNKNKLGIKTVHCDMRRIDFDSKFDAAGNLGTSFGYFDKESDNLLVLRKMYKALKPAGKFMLNIINRDWIMANFSSNDWFEIKGAIIAEKRKFDYSKSINYSVWHFIKDGKERVFEIKLRMYSFHELIAMFKSVGFTNIEGYGSLKDEPVSRDKRMMFIIGAKPKRR